MISRALPAMMSGIETVRQTTEEPPMISEHLGL
jgi:hypothetical protein